MPTLNMKDSVTPKYKEKHIIEYKLKDQEVTAFKKSKYHKAMCSDLVDGMWCISCYPRTQNASDGDDYLGVFVHLISFPLKFKKIAVKYNIYSPDLGPLDHGTATLEVEDPTTGSFWCIQTNRTKHVQSLTFIAEIEILSVEADEEQKGDVSDPESMLSLLSDCK